MREAAGPLVFDIRDFVFADRARGVDELGWVGEQVSTCEASFLDQPGHRLLVGFESAVREDMGDGGASFLQRTADQKRPVTVQRLFFGAHQRDAVALSARQHSLNTLIEQGGLSQQPVLDTAILVVARRVLAAGTQFLAKSYVADAAIIQGSHKRLAVELRMAPTVRNRSYVRDCGDRVLPKQREKFLERMIGMSDGVDIHGHIEHMVTEI
jgi:hypothetical protein